jgi:hypothetical protein
MRYVEGTTISEDMLSCKPIKRRAPAQELFKTAVDFMTEKCIQWSDCVGVCMDAACVMAGNKGGPQGNQQHKLCGHTVQ